ncbi:MAG: hypothetical protein R6W76_14310 [Caldilinea sp.]
MLRLLLFTLILCMLVACTVPPPPPPQPTPLVDTVDPEEYALFSAMIEQNVVGYQQEGSVVILGQTTPDIDSLELALEGPLKPPKKLEEAYRLPNGQPYKLEANFALKRGHQLIAWSEYDELLRSGNASWEDFHAKHPQAGGVYLLSRAGLSPARDQALVSIGYYCGSLCAEGGVFWMVKEDGIWRVKEELVVWMA